MTIRHVTTKLKPQLSDHIASWKNYVQLFDFVLNARTGDLCITTQWIYDITQEFVYQFQGFCQFRCQVGNHSAEVLRTLEDNRSMWNLGQVNGILRGLMAAGRAAGGNSPTINSSPFLVQFGYFASIEMARLECLLGDFHSSLQAISHISLTDRSELFMQLTLCHFNICYHAGVCHMMLRRFGEAIVIFGDIVVFVARILKPGSATTLRSGSQGQMQRMLDRVLALTGIAMTLFPSARVDDQVKELVDSKWADKLRRLQNGDRNSFGEMFDFASPKFISAAVPDYGSGVNVNIEAYIHMVAVFTAEVMQHVTFLKLRSFLGLYASIDLAKLARFNDVDEADLICQLISFKNKATQSRTIGKDGASADVRFYIDNGVLVIDGGNASNAKVVDNKGHVRYFVSGTMKHVEILGQVSRAFDTLGM
jgi:translation initiation factor 3 subunit L